MMNRFRHFDWLAGVFYPLAVVLMEAFWVSPWLAWVGGWPLFAEKRPVLSPASVIIVLAVSLLATRVFLRQKWSMRLVQAAIIGSGFVVILFVLGIEYRTGYAFLSGPWFVHIGRVFGDAFNRPETVLAALPVLLYLWWRGIILGQSTAYFRSIYRSFLLGMVALIVLIILWQVSAASGDFVAAGPGTGLYVIAFFFCGLLAIAICHLYLMRSTMPREEAALTSVWRWMPMMLIVIGGMVVVGFGVASIFSAEFFASISHGFGVFFGVVGKIFNYILIPFNYLFDGLFWLLQLILSWLRNSQPLQPGGTGNMTFPEFPQVATKEIPPEVTMALKWMVLAVIAAAVILILAKAVSRSRGQRAREEIEEIHESLWSWRGLRDDLGLLFRMMGQRFKRKPEPAGPPPYRMDDDISGRLDVREIYRHLLWEAGRSGMARRRQETASEYAGRLGALVPAGSEPLNRITDLYVEVRYGEISAREEQVDNANGLWRTLRGLLRGLRGTLVEN
jgi:hypothetical protein